MGNHERPDPPPSHRRHRLDRRVRIWCRKHDHHIRVCAHVLAEFAMGGATIVAFEWMHPIVTHSDQIAQVFRNVQL